MSGTIDLIRDWATGISYCVKGGVKLDHQSGEKIDHFLVE
jgi:hypothetical protein